MMADHAVNHGTKTNAVEPALEEMRQMMFEGKLTIAGHNNELIEELRNFHRDENFKIVKQRDDLVSALRYAIMMRRHGKMLDDCDGIGYGPLPYSAQRLGRCQETQIAEGTDFDLFTGR
jgi:Terminase RNaseH-like domain